MEDHQFMTHALALGRRNQGHCWPNPAVGCVIVKEGRVVGRGWTAIGGRPHAESQALQRAGALAAGATAFVTLEPCAHQGQTGPCCDALIAAKVARVVIGAPDPDPRVAGRGVAALKAAGIEVVEGVEAEAAAWDHAGFLNRILRGRPHIALKMAASFDGKSAMENGESQWITGPLARRWVHGMRARYDAVLVGGGTVRRDNPNLTVRDIGIERQPVRVVVSNGVDLPETHHLAQTANSVPVWICHGPKADIARLQAWQKLGAVLIECRADKNNVNLKDVAQRLAQKGLTRVFCEGGGALAAALLKEDLIDELIGITAGLVLGARAQPVIGDLPINHLKEAKRFVAHKAHAVGPDLLQIWRRC